MPMAQERPAVPTRPPVFLGCAAALGFLVVAVAGAAFAIAFLESGADTGRVELEQAEAYAPNSVSFVSSRNLYVVRARDGTFFALSDLDAANRANPGRQCRVSAVNRNDPDFEKLLSQYASQFSERAAGMDVLFREGCNNALYDATGLRLNSEDEPNLDRYPVTVSSRGLVEVNLAVRQCTQRASGELFAAIDCP